MSYGHLYATILIAVFLIILVGIVWVEMGPSKIDVGTASPSPSGTSSAPSYATPNGNNGAGYYTQPAASQNAFVAYTAAGFSPQTLTVPAGTTVTFVNQGTAFFRPASDPHPTHTGYPETGGCAGIAFDSCAPVGPGMAWSFKFDKKGAWSYHNHLNPSETGTIIVQ